MTRIIYTRLLICLTIFNANFMLAMEKKENKIYKIYKNDGKPKASYLKKDIEQNRPWSKNKNKTIKSWLDQENQLSSLAYEQDIIVVTNNKDEILAIRGYDSESDRVYTIKESTNNPEEIEDSVTETMNLNTFIKKAKSMTEPEPYTSDYLTTVEYSEHTNPTSNKKNNFKLPEFITSLQPRPGLLDEIKDQMTQYPDFRSKDSLKTDRKPLHLSLFTEAVLSSAVKNYLLDKWVASINENDIFFTLATALQKSNSNLSIFGFKGALAVISLQYKPKLLQNNNFYLSHHHDKTNKFSFQCCPPSAIQQILATQLLGLAYQTIAPKEYQDGWFAGPIGQFVFEQAAITAAKTNRYGVWSWIGAELIQGYVPNITGTTLEKEFKKILVHQARTSTFLQALRDLHTPSTTFTNKNTEDQFTFKAPNTIPKLLAKTAITAVPHCVYHQTPLKKKLKKLKKTNPTFASSIKLIGRYGIPLIVDIALEEMFKRQK